MAKKDEIKKIDDDTKRLIQELVKKEGLERALKKLGIKEEIMKGEKKEEKTISEEVIKMFEEAKKTASEIKVEDVRRSKALSEIAKRIVRVQASAGMIEEAKQTASTIEDSYSRAAALTEIAKAEAEAAIKAAKKS